MLTEIARKYIGYHEKATNDLLQLFDNDTNKGNKDWNKFAWYLDNLPDGRFFNTDKFQANYDWCSIFVHYVVLEACKWNKLLTYARMHEPLTSEDNTGAVVYYVKNFFDQAGKYHSRTSGYKPKKDDIILFYELGEWQHIGIVTEVTDSTITYIHGNSNYPSYAINVEGLSEADIRDSVRENRVPIDWNVIGGYGEMDTDSNEHTARFNKYGAVNRR